MPPCPLYQPAFGYRCGLVVVVVVVVAVAVAVLLLLLLLLLLMQGSTGVFLDQRQVCVRSEYRTRSQNKGRMVL